MLPQPGPLPRSQEDDRQMTRGLRDPGGCGSAPGGSPTPKGQHTQPRRGLGRTASVGQGGDGGWLRAPASKPPSSCFWKDHLASCQDSGRLQASAAGLCGQGRACRAPGCADALWGLAPFLMSTSSMDFWGNFQSLLFLTYTPLQALAYNCRINC